MGDFLEAAVVSGQLLEHGCLFNAPLGIEGFQQAIASYMTIDWRCLGFIPDEL
jgi:hypothetical protein